MNRILLIAIMLYLLPNASIAQNVVSKLGGDTANETFDVLDSSDNVLFRVQGDGRVGIGTPTPYDRIHIKSDANIGIMLEESAGAGGSLRIAQRYGDARIMNFSVGNLDLFTTTTANSSTRRFRITPEGNVGIGTDNPSSILSVGGDGYSSSTIYGGSSIDDGIGVRGEATGLNSIGVLGIASNTGVTINYGGRFQADGNQGRAVEGYSTGASGNGVRGIAEGANGTGVVGVGKTATTSYDFNAIGPGVNYGSTSSIRWKKDITEIDSPLKKLVELRGVYFNWDDEHGGYHDVGMIAEEVGKVLPEIVVYEENGIDADGMDYSKLTPLLVEVAKAQQKLIEDLTKRIEYLEAK